MKGRAREVSIVLLAALVRLWGLGEQSLWMDEAFSHLFATLPLSTTWQAMIVDAVHPPLYYLLLQPWSSVAGASEFALRFPSALAGVLTVALILRAGRDWFGGRTAMWSALLLALNPFHIWYSQEGRMYVLLGFLALAVMAAFWRALRQGRRRHAWMALGGISALAYVTHYFALYLPLVQFVFLLVTFRRHHRVLVRWALVQALAALPLAAWLTALYSVGGGTFGIGWIPKPRPVDLLRTLWSFGMAYDGRVTGLVVVGLLAWGGLLVLGAWRGQGWGICILLVLSLVLPPLVTFLLSVRRPTYVDRFFVGSLPAFLLLSGGGLARLPRASRWVAGLVLIGSGIWGIVRFHTDPLFIKEDWRGAAKYVEAHEVVGDVLALRQIQVVVPLGYYYQGPLEPVAVTLRQRTTPLEEIAAGHERVWMVFRARHDDPHHLAWSEPFDLVQDETEPMVLDWLADHPPKAVKMFPGVTVMLFDLVTGP